MLANHGTAPAAAYRIATPSHLASISPDTAGALFYNAGAEIYAQGEAAHSLYRVEFGAVRIYRLLADGRRQICAFYLSGEVFGFEPDDKHCFFAETICASRIRQFHVSNSHVEYAREILPLALRGMGRAQQHLLVIGRQCALERLCAFLLDTAERLGGLPRLELMMSRMDIADYLGLTIETVSRAFSKLKAKGIIKFPTARSIEIVSWDKLAQLSEGGTW